MNEQDMDRKIVQAFEFVEPPETDLMPGIRKKLDGRPRRRRRTLVFAIVLAVIVFATAAAVITNYVLLMRNIDSPFSSELNPIQISTEDDGICIEMVAATSDGGLIEIYFAIQDMVGDRIDENTGINCTFSDIGGSMLEIYRMFADGVLFVGYQVTLSTTESFTIDNILLYNRTWGLPEGDILISGLSELECVEGESVMRDKLSGGTLPMDFEAINLLKSDSWGMDVHDTGKYFVENLAIVGDDLQMVLYSENTAIQWFDTPEFFLKNEYGDRVDAQESYSYDIRGDGEIGPGDPDNAVSYHVYLFPLDGVDLESYALFYNNSTCEELVGDWSFAIDMELIESIAIDFHYDLSGFSITGIQISSFGVILLGTEGSYLDFEELELDFSVLLHTEAGILELQNLQINNSQAGIKLISRTSEPIDIDTVISITIFGQTIEIN